MGSALYNSPGEGLVEEISTIPHILPSMTNWKNGLKEESIETEPTSVLDNRSSPSPPNSESTLSSYLDVGVSGLWMEDLEKLSSGGGRSFFPSFIGNPCLDLKHLLQTSSPLEFACSAGSGANMQHFGMDDFSLIASLSSDFGSVNGKEQIRVNNENPQVMSPQFDFGEHEVETIQNPSCYVPSLGFSQSEHPFQPPFKRHNPGVEVSESPFLGEDSEILLRRQPFQFQVQPQLLMSLAPQLVSHHLEKPINMKQQDSHVLALFDQLFKVVEMFQTGNFALTQVILARLNHQASLPGKPLVRTAAFYVKEELEKLLTMSNLSGAPPPKSLNLVDIVHKMNAYKLFSGVSPVMQFVDFTCTQALLEALDDDDSIHILDFDIGCGSLWASFIRELPLRKRGASFLKITAFVSTSTHHQFELALVCDNILEFANEFGVSVDIQIVNLDLFDPSSFTLPNFHLTDNEAIAVNFPIWACSHCPFLLHPLMSLIKQCSPKIMTSFDRGCDHYDLSFPSHIVRALGSCANLLGSLDGSSVSLDVINKIEKFLIEPTIERTILGRIRASDKMQANKMHCWKSLFTSAGLFPLAFSNFTESQAHQLVNRIPVRGFHVEKQQASLVLSWQSHELMAASAWRC